MKLKGYMDRLFSSSRELYHWLNLIFALFFLVPVCGFIFFGLKYEIMTDEYFSLFFLCFLIFSLLGLVILRRIFDRVASISRKISEKLAAEFLIDQPQRGPDDLNNIMETFGALEGRFGVTFGQLQQKVSEISGSRPDYTFLLPNQLRLNMDVKFPLDNYLKFINSESDADRDAFKAAFLKDVRQRIKEVNNRDYINPAENTVDYVLVLIPNEQVYRFIHESDPAILDEALKNSVVLCSPVTLYAVLALIRKALDTFKMERATAEILGLVSLFEKQWLKFMDSMDKMGKKLQDAQTEYDYLLTTRKSQLEKPVKKIGEIRRERNIEEIKVIEGEATQIEGGQADKTL